MARRSFKSVIPEIPLEVWRPLYAWADELRGLALWEEMGDAELLGVDHPQTGEPMLGAVMGSLGEVFGLALHYEPEGIRFAVETALGRSDEPDMEEFRQTSVLKVEFVGKVELAPEEKQRVKDLNFQPAPVRPIMWPIFESLRSGYIPWHLDLAEAELLLYALPRLTGLGGCVRQLYESDNLPPDDGFAFWPRGRALAEPLQTEEIDWRRLRVTPRRAPETFAVENATEEALRRLPQVESWLLEVDASSGFGVIDEGPRPWFMKMGVAAEARTGLVLGAEIGRGPEEAIETLAGRTLVQALQRGMARPAAVHVQQVRIEKALEGISARLGIQLELRRELPSVARFHAATLKRFGSPPRKRR
jgi:hypothetical protein